MTTDSESPGTGSARAPRSAAPAENLPDSGPLSIDVISDVVCPWCFVGKRQLEQALVQLQQAHPDMQPPVVRWHPFQLNPELPPEGIAREDYLIAKFGEGKSGNTHERVKAAAQEVGLELKMGDIERQPNTVRAHALISLAQDTAQEQVVEGLFASYFQQGADLTREETLIGIARSGGLPEPLIEAAITDASVHETIRTADAHARELGVQGVPFFIFNRQLAVSGAAGAQTLFQACERVMAGEGPTSAPSGA